MLRVFLFSVVFAFSTSAFAQNVFHAFVKDKETHEALIGANVFIRSLEIGGSTDAEGRVEIEDIPQGKYKIKFGYIGYQSLEIVRIFPLPHPEKVEIFFLEKTPIEGEEIVVSATRTNGVVEDTPVRVEVLGYDEVLEERGIKPGNVSKLLGETSGIQIQQTSATTGNMTFRIQGLQGRYTQLLKDGFPLYSGFSSGLSLLQIPPLDLQQVEVIRVCTKYWEHLSRPSEFIWVEIVFLLVHVIFPKGFPITIQFDSA